MNQSSSRFTGFGRASHVGLQTFLLSSEKKSLEMETFHWRRTDHTVPEIIMCDRQFGSTESTFITVTYCSPD